MQINLYARKINGKTHFYYEYYDQSGRRIRKSTGCERKADAVAFVNRLEYDDDQKRRNKNRKLFADYTTGFFKPGEILARWKAHGKILKKTTLASYQIYLEKYLVPWFGKMYLDDITAKMLDEKLMTAKKCGNHSGAKEQELSGSAKNCIKDTLSVILKEAQFDGFVEKVPAFKVYVRNSRRQDILTDAELFTLFPFDQKKIADIWKVKSDKKDTRPGQMFEVMAAVSVSCGLRSGEILALRHEQILPKKGIIIDQVIDRSGNIDKPKKGTDNDPRFRVVPLSDYTLDLLDRWVDSCTKKEGLLFTYHGKVVRGCYLLARFKKALDEAGIETTKRRITFHALRYTYNTKMKNAIPREMLRDIIGHRSEEMTNLYDRPVLEDRLDEYRKQILPAVNGFWKAQ